MLSVVRRNPILVTFVSPFLFDINKHSECDLGYHMELFSSSFKTYKTLDWDGTSNKFVCSICGSSPQPRQYKKK